MTDARDTARHAGADPSAPGPLWRVERPGTLVVACSDGRLQEATDAFLSGALGVVHYDRFYVPGGAGALAATGRDFIRARQMRGECRYLMELHGVQRLILLFHGPAAGGPPAAVCADYRRKLSWASPAVIGAKQVQDASELVETRAQWAGACEVLTFRCEVQTTGHASFVDLRPR